LLRRDDAAVVAKVPSRRCCIKARETNVAALGNHWASKVCLANVSSVKLLRRHAGFGAALAAAPSTLVGRQSFAAMPREALQICRSGFCAKDEVNGAALEGSEAETTPLLKR
jgi:hypothetical protein